MEMTIWNPTRIIKFIYIRTLVVISTNFIQRIGRLANIMIPYGGLLMLEH